MLAGHGPQKTVGEERLVPGHWPGSLCFYSAGDEILFAGDVLQTSAAGKGELMRFFDFAALRRIGSCPEKPIIHGPSLDPVAWGDLGACQQKK
jgi:hypothetical protein